MLSPRNQICNCRRMRLAALAFALLALGLTLTGCNRPRPEAQNPLTIDSLEYDRVYDAAIAALRDAGFRVDRQDYRFGRLTTFPQGSPTALEVWDPDNTTAAQAWQSTLVDLQRIARVFIDPLPGEEPPAYDLRVEVILEQRQTPIRRMTGSISRNVFSSLEAVPTDWRQRGIDANYWQPVGRDTALEDRLLHDILHRATFNTP